MIEMFEALDPSTDCQSKFPSLVPLVASFPNIIKESQIQQLDNEWRKLAIETLPFNKEGMEPEEFWGKLLEVKNGAGETQFSVLCHFMGNMLSLPHANVDAEKIFSSVNLIKTKLRNKLKTSTVRAILKAKNGIKLNEGCVEFTPSSDMRMMMTSETLYRRSSSPSSSSDESDEN
uniref:HAT C-terminal dimerisation domain-containing protein n=1 Tax=Amphimedon queenslandica TaxID=400682 RepID=A0A1X7VXS2_AMPQE